MAPRRGRPSGAGEACGPSKPPPIAPAAGFSLIEELAPQGAATPLHVHEEEETFYVLEGELTFYLGDGGPIAAPAGSFVHVPVGEAHSFRVVSETARYLIITIPQHERFYRAAFGDPAPSRNLPPDGPVDMERINAAAREYKVEGLGLALGPKAKSTRLSRRAFRPPRTGADRGSV